MRNRLHIIGVLVCSLSAFAVAFMPLAGVVHDHSRHDAHHSACVAHATPAAAGFLVFAETEPTTDSHFRRSGGEARGGHDSATCPTCQVLLQLATSVVPASAITALPGMCRAASHGRPIPRFAAEASHATHFPRAPPAV